MGFALSAFPSPLDPGLRKGREDSIFQGGLIAWEIQLFQAASTGLRKTKRAEIIALLPLRGKPFFRRARRPTVEPIERHAANAKRAAEAEKKRCLGSGRWHGHAGALVAL